MSNPVAQDPFRALKSVRKHSPGYAIEYVKPVSYPSEELVQLCKNLANWTAAWVGQLISRSSSTSRTGDVQGEDTVVRDIFARIVGTSILSNILRRHFLLRKLLHAINVVAEEESLDRAEQNLKITSSISVACTPPLVGLRSSSLNKGEYTLAGKEFLKRSQRRRLSLIRKSLPVLSRR